MTLSHEAVHRYRGRLLIWRKIQGYDACSSTHFTGAVTDMPVKLVHHTQESITGGVSPFDAAIMDIATGRDVRIACPFLGVRYLQRVIDRASAWRLLTDVEAWLASQTASSRTQVVDFILTHRDRVRHCADLHAKVVVGGDHALVGSANFTAKGIGRRIEMSVRLDECEQVVELTEWFDRLWDETGPVNETELRACAASIPERPPTGAVVRLSGASPKVRARLVRVVSPPVSPAQPHQGAFAGSTPPDPNRPRYDVLGGRLGDRTNRIHDAMVGSGKLLSPSQIEELARCKAASPHLDTMKGRKYAVQVGRGLWKLTDKAIARVRRGSGG